MPLLIPLELVEYFIDFLHDDIHALTACALASRVLLPRTRFHIWYELTVPVQAHPLHDRMRALLEILDANADIAPLVRSLTLKMALSSQPRSRIPQRWDDPAGTMLLWEKFPNLRILKFTNLDSSNGVHQLLPLAYSMPNLEEVAVAGFSAVPPRWYPALLSYRDSIVKLDAPPRLKRLSIADGWMGSIFIEDLAYLLLEPSMRPPLEALNFSYIASINSRLPPIGRRARPSLWELWNTVVASLGQTLRHCTFDVPAAGDRAFFASRYDSLQRCAQLESLGLVCTIYPDDAPEHRPFLFIEMLAELLSSGPCAPFPHFETLELELTQYVEPTVEGCAEACTKLASVLEDRTRYPHFKRLAVRVQMNSTMTTAEGSVSMEGQKAAQTAVLRACLGRVEVVGVQLEISVA